MTDRVLMTICITLLAIANIIAVADLARGKDQPRSAPSSAEAAATIVRVEPDPTGSSQSQHGEDARPVQADEETPDTKTRHAAYRPASEVERLLWDASLVVPQQSDALPRPFVSRFGFKTVRDTEGRYFRIPITY